MKNYIVKLLLLLIILPWFGCVDDIDLVLPKDRTDGVVIEGRLIESENSFVEVYVTKVFDFTTDSRVPVRTTSVTLIDEDGTRMELRMAAQGYFTAALDENSPIQAKVGRSYKIEVVIFGGRTYESDFDIITESVAPDEVYFQTVKQIIQERDGDYREVERLQLTADLPLDNTLSDGLLWEVMSTYKITDTPSDGTPSKVCYIDRNVSRNEVTYFNLAESEASYLSEWPLAVVTPDHTFNEGIFFSVSQYALSEAATRYWSQINTIKNYSGNLFDDPLGLVSSNITQTKGETDLDIFGYFYTASEQLVRIKADPELVPDRDPYCPAPRMVMRPCMQERVCCDCLSENNSTTEKPNFWIE